MEGGMCPQQIFNKPGVARAVLQTWSTPSHPFPPNLQNTFSRKLCWKKRYPPPKKKFLEHVQTYRGGGAGQFWKCPNRSWGRSLKSSCYHFRRCIYLKEAVLYQYLAKWIKKKIRKKVKQKVPRRSPKIQGGGVKPVWQNSKLKQIFFSDGFP